DANAELADPSIARAYLDLIHAALDQGSCDDDTEDALQDALVLPELSGQPTPFRSLHSNAVLPQNAHEDARRLFWNWLRQNGRRIPPRERPKLAEIPIWPDEKGRLCALRELCDPRSRRVASVLRDFIRRPHEQVRRSRLVSVRGKARTAIRRSPTDQEVIRWLHDRLRLFPPGIRPDARAVSALERFEAALATLLQDAGISRALKGAVASLPALAQDGLIRERAKLVTPSLTVERLALPSRFLLKRASALDR